MFVKVKSKVVGCVLCIAILALSVPQVSATWQTQTVPAGTELDVHQPFAAGDRVQISIRIDGNMLARFVFMNSLQFINWTTNRSFAELTNDWIYNDPSISQEDRIYEVPANDMYYIGFINNNVQNITIHYEFLVQQPSTITGMPLVLLGAMIAVVVTLTCWRVFRRSRLDGGRQEP